MSLKRGNGLPKMGNHLPMNRNTVGIGSYEQAISRALQRELGGSHKALKTLMRWTGASARSAKNWLAGSAGPSGDHLISLIRHSDAAFEAVLQLSSRERDPAPQIMAAARVHLIELLALMDTTRTG